GLGVNKGGSVRVAGSVLPLDLTRAFDLNLNMDNVSLQPFSPFVKNAFGVGLANGTLSGTARGAVAANALKGRIGIDLIDFLVADMTAAEEKAFTDQYAISPSSILNILRDSDGDIRLKVPVSGTLDDPNFDLSKVKSKAIGGLVGSLLPHRWFTTREPKMPKDK
ncbi:MAG: DUF748 domain-containing protein, partial [Alphaproteobacteria bacterium]